MVQDGRSPFAAALRAIADRPGPLPEEEAQLFLQQWPLEAVFRELSGPQVDGATIEDACAALAKLFATAHGASLLPSILPYAAAALQSPSAPLRRLAVQQLGRLLAASGGEQQPQALDLLLRALADEDVGVASDAEAALRQLSAPPLERLAPLLSPGTPGGAALRALAGSADPVLRMRSLTLLVALAAASPAAAQAVRQSGLLEPLLQELQDPDDLLSCMAALQLVRDAAEQCDTGMALALQEAVAPRLGTLLQHPEPVLQSGALRAAASLLAASLEAGVGPMAVDDAGAEAAGNGIGPGGAAALPASAAAAAQPLLAALKTVLDVGGAQEFAPELEEAALDAVGILGLQRLGAEVLLSDGTAVANDVAYKALGRSPSPAQRLAALHTLATLAGAERSGRSGKLLAPAAEDALRVAVFEGAGAAWAGASPADVLRQQLDQPFLEQRVAVYRCLAALAARDWMAGQVCSHTALLAFLCDPQSEASKQGCEWRHACVQQLAATISDVLGGGLGAGGPHHAVLAAAAQRVQAAERGGPYGAAAGPQEQHVATVPGV